jgi:hypothetical protein
MVLTLFVYIKVCSACTFPYRGRSFARCPETNTCCTALQEGRDLPAMDNNGLSDPYCRILVAGQKACKTSIIKKSLNPKWEPPAEAKFTLNDLQQVVEIEVWDKVWVGFAPVGRPSGEAASLYGQPLPLVCIDSH